MRLHTANRSFCTHAATHSKQELLHTCAYTQQTGVTAHMWLHRANGSYCTHVAQQTGVTANMRLHTATGVTAHMGLYIRNTSYFTHAATHNTTPPFNFYCVNRASQFSKDRIKWSNKTLPSVHHPLSGSVSTLFIYNKRHYCVPNCCGIHCTELLWKYAVPNCCGV